MTRLSKNFTLDEFTRSVTALRLGLDNEPDAESLHNLKALATNVLQPARDYMGIWIRVNSGFRGRDLNFAVGGSRTSDHMVGAAADIETHPETRENMFRLGAFIERELEFKQLIWEFGQWIHVSYLEGRNRGEVLEFYRSGRRVQRRPFSFL